MTPTPTNVRIDPFSQARQHFARLYGREPSTTELADTLLAYAVFLYSGNLDPTQICQRVAATLTPGTPAYTFMTNLLANP